MKNLVFKVKPFVCDTGHKISRKIPEEAAEAFSAYELCENAQLTKGCVPSAYKYKFVYECLDNIQATSNLLASMGIAQAFIDKVYEDVVSHNTERGRYDKPCNRKHRVRKDGDVERQTVVEGSWNKGLEDHGPGGGGDGGVGEPAQRG